MLLAMDLIRPGSRLRAIRVARRERIRDVAARSGLSPSTISRNERGAGPGTPVGTLVRHAAALGASLEMLVRWRGADLDRLVNAAHSALHEAVARLFGRLPGWIAVPEVSFSIYGERGVIDWLAWHPATRSLLVIELKTTLVDVQALLATIDRYVRLAPRIARERGWHPVTVSMWVLFEDSSRNRRAVAAHADVFRRVVPADGRVVRAWLRNPAGRIAAVSFLANSHRVTPRPRIVRPKGRGGAAPSANSVAAGPNPSACPRSVSPGENLVEAGPRDLGPAR